MKSHEDMIRDLKTFPLLSKLSDEDLTLLAGVMREQSVRAGTEILREGETGEEMDLLLEGSVDVLKTTPFGEP